MATEKFRSGRRSSIRFTNYSDVLRQISAMSTENPLIKNKIALGLRHLLKPTALQVKQKMESRGSVKSGKMKEKIRSSGKTGRRKGYIATGIVGADEVKYESGTLSIQALEWGTIDRVTKAGHRTGAIGKSKTSGYKLGQYSKVIGRDRKRISDAVGDLLKETILKYR